MQTREHLDSLLAPEATGDGNNPLRLTLLAAFGLLRKREMTDGLVEILLGTVHRLASRAERRVDKEWLADRKRVEGKNNLLFKVAEASISEPEGGAEKRYIRR
jgi:hypothetical protein